MADDIVTRLRHIAWLSEEGADTSHLTDAADEIGRLRSMIEALTRNSLTHLSIGLTRESGRHAE